ncbi:MAG: PQQ-binding-like beta-propeller repeat protein [Rikenellaceae bacterium]|jgi:outer membrane protein assembly factor BamB|nr:PQQ-binding-like beta-propeller repeat protein [Rikenellaceae bacterium]
MGTKFLFGAAMACICTTVTAQRQADAVIPFQQDIQQIVINPANGHVIVKEKDAITSEDPETKTADWTISKADIVKIGAVESAVKVLDALSSGASLAAAMQSSDAVEIIQDSPYLRCVIENRDVIINSLNGKVVFNSGNCEYRIMESRFLPEADEFLLLVTDGKIISYVLWDLQKGSAAWKTELGEAESMMSMFKSMFKNDASVDKTHVAGNAIYASLKGALYRLDRTDGKIVWQAKERINSFYPTQSGENLVIIKNSGGMLSTKQALNIWRTADGSPVWKSDISTKYILYLEDWSDRLLIACADGFNFYSYADGKKLWKKAPKGDNLKQVIPIDGNYLYIADKEMNLVNDAGVNIWKKPIEISDNGEDAVYFLGKTENNRVLYLTATYGNMVDCASGKKIWKKNIEFDKDRPLLYVQDEATKAFLVYNNKRVYKLDPNASDKPEPAVKLKEIKDDKTLSGIELFGWGVSLTGQSEVIGMNLDGATRYHNVYKEPGVAGRKLLGAAAVGLKISGGVSQAQVTFYSVNEKGERVEEASANMFGQNARAAGAAGGEIGDFIAARAKRFNALKQNRDFAFILNKGDNGAELVKVKKEDGKEVDKIGLDNNKPVYEVDPVNGAIYYVYKNELRIFR